MFFNQMLLNLNILNLSSAEFIFSLPKLKCKRNLRVMILNKGPSVTKDGKPR